MPADAAGSGDGIGSLPGDVDAIGVEDTTVGVVGAGSDGAGAEAGAGAGSDETGELTGGDAVEVTGSETGVGCETAVGCGVGIGSGEGAPTSGAAAADVTCAPLSTPELVESVTGTELVEFVGGTASRACDGAASVPQRSAAASVARTTIARLERTRRPTIRHPPLHVARPLPGLRSSA